MSTVSLSRELCASGYSYSEQARMTRAAQLYRLRRGAYSADAHGLDPRLAHLQLLEATVRQSSSDAVVSHMSAAAVHGLPVWADALHQVHLSRDREGGGKTRRYVRLHPGRLSAEDVVEVDGFLVTSLARTVVDLARTASLQRAVAIGDAALAAGLGHAELDAVLAEARGRTGAAAARRAVALLDARSETPGESSSRVVLYQLGLPPTHLQYEVLDPLGRFVARTDFCWEEARTLGEFDGKIKYGRILKEGQSVSDVLFEEKRREDALRDLGWQIVRWVWDDLAHPAALGERIRRALARGRRG